MELSKKNKAYLLGVGFLIAILSLLFFVGEIIVPFVIAIFVGYLLNPTILKIQKKIKNRSLAVTSFLSGVLLFIFGVVFFMGTHIVQDTNRFVSSAEVFVEKNEQQMNDVKENILSFFDDIYQSETIQKQIETGDVLTDETQKQDVMTSLKSVYSFFLENPDSTTDVPEQKSWNWFYISIYLILYSVIILYTYDYFQEKITRYFGRSKHNKSKLSIVWQNFETVFLKYFRQRTKVVLVSSCIFILAFSLIGLPGAVFIGIIAGVLTYASEFHYFSLPLTVVGCWVLSIEHDTHFLVFFGIVLLVYLIVSVLEETIFFSKIMKSVNGMNSAIMILAFALWTYVFGGFIGTVIALPLTQLILIYLDYLFVLHEDK